MVVCGGAGGGVLHRGDRRVLCCRRGHGRDVRDGSYDYALIAHMHCFNHMTVSDCEKNI